MPNDLLRTVTAALACCLLLGACGDEASTKADASGGEKPATGAAAPGAMTPPMPGADAAAAADVPDVSPDTVVLTVNGVKITQGEIDEELRGLMFGGMKVEPARMAMVRKQFGSQAEKRLIDQKLLEQAADAEGIVASEEKVAAQWKSIEARIPGGMDKAAFLASKGFSVEEADKRIRLGVKLEALLTKHAAGAVPSDEDVRKYYDDNLLQFQVPEQVHARHILVKVAPGATDEEKAAAKMQVQGYAAEVAEKGNARFQELAKEHSACPSSKDGGSLGFFGRGQMVPEFDKVAFTLEPGKVSEPVLTQFGWHILLVEEKREAGTREFDDVKAQLKHRLEMQGKQTAQQDYLESLRKAAKIERPSAAAEPQPGK